MKGRRVLSGAMMGLALAGAAAAQENATNQIVVTATRTSRDTWQVPANVTVLTSEDLRRSAKANLADALQDLAGVSVRSSSGGPATAEIGMRGFGENSHGRVLVLLDGRRLNSPDMATINWLQIPLSSVERVEVVEGANTALYGDHAVGGVVNIVTRKGSLEPATEVSVQAGSYETTVVEASTAGNKDRLSYVLSASRSESEGYRDRSAYLSAGGRASLEYDVSDTFHTALGVSYQEVEYEIPGYLTLDQMRENPRQSVNTNDSAANRSFQADLSLEEELTTGHRVKMGWSFGRQEKASDMESWMSWSDTTLESLGATPRYTWDGKVAGRRNQLLVGLDFYQDTLDVKRFTDETHTVGTMDAEVTKETVGAYARDEFHFSEALILALGGRVETATYEAEVFSGGTKVVDGEVTHDENAVDASVNYLFAKRSKAFVKAATVYRYPFVDEQVSYYGYGADQFYSDIRPEEGVNVEAGTDVWFSDQWRAGLTLYQLNMKDEISYNYTTYRNENLDRTRRQGASASVTYQPWKSVKVQGSYTFTDAVFTDGAYDGKEVPLVPEHKATLKASVRLPGRVTLEGTGRYVGECWLGGDNVNAGPKLSDYAVADILARWSPFRERDVEMYVGVDNVFDEEYASLGYRGVTQDGYYPAAGASFKGGVTYRF